MRFIMQITSVRSVILFHHVMSISIRQQSKQQLSEKDDEITKWTLDVLPIMFTRFDLVSISCRICSSMYLCIFDLFGHFNNV